MTQTSPLRRRMTGDMTVRNRSPATQRSCISAVSKFSRYFGRSPEKLELEDVRAFHLVSTGISWPGLNQIVCALRFFCGVPLGGADIPERIALAREPRKLPVVLGAGEAVQFPEAVPSLNSRAALTKPVRRDCGPPRSPASGSRTPAARAASFWSGMAKARRTAM